LPELNSLASDQKLSDYMNILSYYADPNYLIKNDNVYIKKWGKILQTKNSHYDSRLKDSFITFQYLLEDITAR